jgi:hypothetical protein
MSRDRTALIGLHGEVVTHQRITRFPDVVQCAGTMEALLEQGKPIGTDLDHIARCSECGSEYAVQTGTGRAIRAGQRARDEES